MNCRIFQRLIPFLELNIQSGVTKSDIVDFIISVADISGDTMAPRRFSSIVSWLESLGIVRRENERFFLSKSLVNKKIKTLEFKDVSEPILPRSTDLHEYETVKMRTDKAQETVAAYIRDASADRADNAHRNLVNLLATKVKKAGSIPRFNQLIDLATRYEDIDYIFEVKSVTDRNLKNQVRSGVSQLYEYRYLQNLPEANLVLVVESPFSRSTEWMVDYLELDRKIHVIWDGNDSLFSKKETAKKLSFLGIE